MGIIIETFHGKVPNTKAAAIIFEACRRGILDRTNRRLLDEERRALKGGEVFVFAEKSSGIKRWTDGKYWSPSRVIGEFLVYFELDTRMHNIKREQDINPSLRSRIEREGLKVQVGNKGTFIYRKNGLIKKTVSMNDENDIEHMIIYEYPPLDNCTDEEREKLYPPQAYIELADIEPSEEILKRFQKPNHSSDRERRLVEGHGSDDNENENGSGSSENDKFNDSQKCQPWPNVIKSENEGDHNKESSWNESRESSKVLAFSSYSPINYSTSGIAPNSPYPHSPYHCSSIHQHAYGDSQMHFHNNLSNKSPSLHVINPIFLSRSEKTPTTNNTVASNKFGEHIPRDHRNSLPAISGRHHHHLFHYNLNPITNTANFHQMENAPIEPSLSYPRYTNDDVRDDLRSMSPIASSDLFSNSSLRNWPTTDNSGSRDFSQNNHNSADNEIENGNDVAGGGFIDPKCLGKF
ncbi:177_t:CDS:2 [Ambispora leptoticha]|uniref:177_t:CDS:1 n=1 Tax=Ambispora leptoticha TaxID=144679 RepID=A0A9N9C0P5_9GLOM|nr:177_t:CDS:2 [Ambispora leptoticha]